MTSTVLVTGASSGIGKAAVQYFQQQGWNVAATMRHPDAEQELSALANVKCFRLDVLDEASILQAIDHAKAAFGGIDVVINNAGYGAIGAFEAATREQIQHQFDVNVFGLMNVTRAILPYFREKNQGIILNVSSIGGRTTFPIYSVYHATKWAVEGFSESLQYELNPFNIKVKIIEPGIIKTDFYDRSQVIFQNAGLTAYKRYQELALSTIKTLNAKAPGPEVVARVMFKAATDRSDRMRYSVGGQAPLLLFLRRILPNRWFFAIVRKVVERNQL